jgi:hypothetical protein
MMRSEGAEGINDFRRGSLSYSDLISRFGSSVSGSGCFLSSSVSGVALVLVSGGIVEALDGGTVDCFLFDESDLGVAAGVRLRREGFVILLMEGRCIVDCAAWAKAASSSSR